MSKYGDQFLGAVKYLIAGLMIVSGISTMFTPLTPLDGALGLIYASRVTLVILGIVFTSCGIALLYGKVRRSRVWTGRGLMGVYLSLVFATLLQGLAFSWHPGYWLSNAIFALITGALWLRWKFKTSYFDPKHFRDDIHRLR